MPINLNYQLYLYKISAQFKQHFFTFKGTDIQTTYFDILVQIKMNIQPFSYYRRNKRGQFNFIGFHSYQIVNRNNGLFKMVAKINRFLLVKSEVFNLESN